ncbi:MAG TPA: hypothetical protein VF719_13015 [Abditibacteriaceae bacterium]|jgi:hypothetical protein
MKRRFVSPATLLMAALLLLGGCRNNTPYQVLKRREDSGAVSYKVLVPPTVTQKEMTQWAKELAASEDQYLSTSVEFYDEEDKRVAEYRNNTLTVDKPR